MTAAGGAIPVNKRSRCHEQASTAPETTPTGVVVGGLDLAGHDQILPGSGGGVVQAGDSSETVGSSVPQSVIDPKDWPMRRKLLALPAVPRCPELDRAVPRWPAACARPVAESRREQDRAAAHHHALDKVAAHAEDSLCAADRLPGSSSISAAGLMSASVRSCGRGPARAGVTSTPGRGQICHRPGGRQV